MDGFSIPLDMKMSPSLLILLSLLNLGGVGILALKLSKLETLVAGASSTGAHLRLITPEPPVKPDFPEPVTLRKAEDIVVHINQTVPETGIEGLARALAEMDEWLYRPEDEELASRHLEGVADVLREKIAARIAVLSKSAVDASDGQKAAEKMSQINALLSLYPSPKTVEQRSKLEQTTAIIVSASRRVEDIRRLRYNAWAITQIESGLSGYNKNKKTIGTDEDTLTKSCIGSLNVIDPAFLEPAALDLYNYVFGLTRDAVSDRVKLAKGFADAARNRKSPHDF